MSRHYDECPRCAQPIHRSVRDMDLPCDRGLPYCKHPWHIEDETCACGTYTDATCACRTCSKRLGWCEVARRHDQAVARTG